MTRLTLFLIVEGASFIAASLVHRGILVAGYEHHRAAIAETVIGTVLLSASVLAWVFSHRTRPIAVVAQSFALLGTLVGLLTIAVGVGPRTAPDLAYHAFILALLVAGLIVAARTAPAR